MVLSPMRYAATIFDFDGTLVDTGDLKVLIEGFDDLKSLLASALPLLAAEIRRFLIYPVSATGRHLGWNPGAVELTIALRRVSDSSQDVVLFDTSHQSYVHKVLTGRTAEFEMLRRAGGLSGYPSAAESLHDVVQNSHASTALFYADGLVKGFRLTRCDRRVIAVVGDATLTGGMAWEALNDLASTEHLVVIVLDDNGRSYASTVGGLASHLASLRAGAERSLFESLGPIDGHNSETLVAAGIAATVFKRLKDCG